VKTEVVTTGKWDAREFDGIVVEGNYYSKGDARRSKDATIRAEYWRARRALRDDSYSLSDSPLKQYTDNGVTAYHHDLRETDK